MMCVFMGTADKDTQYHASAAKKKKKKHVRPAVGSEDKG